MSNFKRLDLKFTTALEPVVYLVPSDNYDPTGKDGRLIIRSTAGVELFNKIGAAAGITVVDHVLTDDILFPDGSSIAEGETVKAFRIAPDLSGLAVADPLNVSMKRNWYGFTPEIDKTGWGLEGHWDIYPDTGPVPHCNDNAETGVQVSGSVQVGVFFPGTQGERGDTGSPGAPNPEDYALIANVLVLDNTVPFMPVNDYEPVTKIYQDLSFSAHLTAYNHDDIDTALQPGDALDNLDTTVTGAELDADHTKLIGINDGATANSPDATLLDRSNHTGTQAASTISDFDTEVSGNGSVAANTAKVSADGSVTTHNDVTDAGSGLITTAAERVAWNAKQNALTFDLVPTDASTNPVESNGVFDAFVTHEAHEDSHANTEQTLTNKTIGLLDNHVESPYVAQKVKSALPGGIAAGIAVTFESINPGTEIYTVHPTDHTAEFTNGILTTDLPDDSAIGVAVQVGRAEKLPIWDASWVAGVTILFVNGSGVLVSDCPIAPDNAQPVALVIRKTGSTTDLHILIGPSLQHAADVQLLTGSGTPVVNNLQSYLTNIGSSGFFDGGEVTDAGGGQVAVAVLSGMIRDTADSTAELKSFASTGTVGIAIPTDTVRYIFCNNSGVISVDVNEFLEAENLILIGWAVNEAGVIVHVGNLGVRLDESIGQAGRFIRRVHSITRDKRRGGLFFGNSGTRNIIVSMGVLWWGRTEYPISAKDTSGADTFDIYSSSGKEASDVQQWPNLQYDNGGTLTNLGANKWGVLWFYLETDEDIICVYGTAVYNTQAAAALAEEPLSSVPDRVTASGVLAARLIFKSGDGASAWSSAFKTAFSGVAVSDHADLSGIGIKTHAELDIHLGSIINPHGVTKTQVGLGNVDNTADLFIKAASNITLVTSSDLLGLGVTPTAKLHAKGSGSTNATYALKIDNSSSVPLMSIQNDGQTSFYSTISSLSNIFEWYSGSSTLRSQISGYGGQSWFLGNEEGEAGRIVYSTPAGFPGIVFFDTLGANRNQIKSIHGVGLAMAASLTSSPGADRLFVVPDGVGINKSSVSAELHIKGSGTTSATYALKIDDSSDNTLLYVRDDGVVMMEGLPTASAGLPTGALWSNAGVINIV